MAFGLLVFHRYADISGFAILQNQPYSYFPTWILCAFLGLLIFIGFLTPFALVALGLFLLFPPLAGNLGDQVSLINLWGLLLLGAGEAFSVDEKLLQDPRWKKQMRSLYRLSNVCSLGQIRFLLVLFFWGVCFSAVSYHFADPLWKKGQVLQVMLDTPYLSQFYWFFHAIRLNHPTLYHWGCTLALFVQATWELFLFPLMFFRAGRIFVVIQGLIFFLVSIVVLELQYLPLQELVWWTMALAYPFRAQETEEKWNPLLITGATGLVFSLISGIALTPSEMALRIGKVFGQFPVSVFNREDLNMGSHYLILTELDATGNPKRVVPLQDIDGGRLDYLRNDLLYFSHSLAWCRQPPAWRFQPDGKPLASTDELAERVVRLDSCLQKRTQPSEYAAYFFSRKLKDADKYPYWGESSFIGRKVYRSEKEDSWLCTHAFNLPPGHPKSNEREIATLKAIQNLVYLRGGRSLHL